MTTVRRILTWFNPQTEEFVGQADLKDYPLGKLQNLYGEPADEPMVDCYPVGPEHVAALQPYVNHDIRLDRYHYFVEAEAVPIPESAASDST